MKLIKLLILTNVFFLFGTGLYAEVGLNDDSLIEVKPKACDFQWWKGSKNYNTADTVNKKVENKTTTTEK